LLVGRNRSVVPTQFGLGRPLLRGPAHTLSGGPGHPLLARLRHGSSSLAFGRTAERALDRRDAVVAILPAATVFVHLQRRDDPLVGDGPMSGLRGGEHLARVVGLDHGVGRRRLVAHVEPVERLHRAGDRFGHVPLSGRNHFESCDDAHDFPVRSTPTTTKSTMATRRDNQIVF
jgi:hypothetical protein